MGQRRLPPLAYGGRRPEQDLLDEAVRLKEERRYGDAETLLKRFTATYPTIAAGWSELAIVRLSRRRVADARVAAERAVAIDSSAIGVLLEIGASAYEIGDRVEAARALTTVVAHEPLEPIANYYIGRVAAFVNPAAAATAYATALAGTMRPEYDESAVSVIDVKAIPVWSIRRLAELPPLAACVEEPIRAIVDAATAMEGGRPGVATALLADLQASGQQPWDAAATAMLRRVFRSKRPKR